MFHWINISQYIALLSFTFGGTPEREPMQVFLLLWYQHINSLEWSHTLRRFSDTKQKQLKSKTIPIEQAQTGKVVTNSRNLEKKRKSTRVSYIPVWISYGPMLQFFLMNHQTSFLERADEPIVAVSPLSSRDLQVHVLCLSIQHPWNIVPRLRVLSDSSI